MGDDTRMYLRQFYDQNGSLRKTAKALGLPASSAGLLSDVLRGRDAHVSLESENRIRLAMGLPVVTTFAVPACQDCGSVHHARCNGAPVAAVVTLAPGDKVRRARPEPPEWVTWAAEMLRERLDARYE